MKPMSTIKQLIGGTGTELQEIVKVERVRDLVDSEHYWSELDV